MKPESASLTVLVLGIASLVLSEFSWLGMICGVLAIVLGIWANKKICRDRRSQNRVRIGMLAAFFGLTTFLMMLVMSQTISEEDLKALEQAATQSATEAAEAATTQ